MTNDAAATSEDNVFNYDLESAPRGQKVLLLTIGGVETSGVITDLSFAAQMGIIAWYPVPKRDKYEEFRRGYLKQSEAPTRRPRKQDKERQRMYSSIRRSRVNEKEARRRGWHALTLAIILSVLAVFCLYLDIYNGVVVCGILLLCAFFGGVEAAADASAWRREAEYEEEILDNLGV